MNTGEGVDQSKCLSLIEWKGKLIIHCAEKVEAFSEVILTQGAMAPWGALTSF